MKRKFSFKNLILWIVFYFNLSVFLLSICCLDSEKYWIYGIISVISLAYMVLFGIANYDRFERWAYGKRR